MHTVPFSLYFGHKLGHDFADDIVLLSQRHSGSQTKTSRMTSAAKSIGLKVNIKKTKVLRVNANNQFGSMI